MKKMNFYLAAPHVKFLEEESKKLDINMSEIMRRVMDKYISKEKYPDCRYCEGKYKQSPEKKGE